MHITWLSLLLLPLNININVSFVRHSLLLLMNALLLNSFLTSLANFLEPYCTPFLLDLCLVATLESMDVSLDALVTSSFTMLRVVE